MGYADWLERWLGKQFYQESLLAYIQTSEKDAVGVNVWGYIQKHAKSGCSKCKWIVKHAIVDGGYWSNVRGDAPPEYVQKHIYLYRDELVKHEDILNHFGSIVHQMGIGR